MKGGTLAGRIFGAVAGVLAVLFVVGWFFGQGRILAFHREAVEHRLDALSALLEPRAREWLAGGTPPGGIAAEVRDLPMEGRRRVTLVAPDGTVLADNVAQLPLANHGDRPEIVAAAATGRGSAVRRSETTGVATLYIAHRVASGGRPAGFLRLAEPLEQVDREVAALGNALLLGAAGVLVLGLLASWILARQIARPLAEMERSASDYAEGRLDRRVPAPGPSEVARLAVSLNRMADQIRRRIDVEARLRSDLESVLGAMVEGVVAVDRREGVLFMNLAGATLLGLPAPVPAGGGLWESLRFPALEELLRAVLAGKEAPRRDAPSPAGNGRLLEVSAVPLGAGGAVAILRAVTEVRRLERIRMDFVANVSHELRTPLTGVAGALETLQDGSLEGEERRRFLDIARRNATRLQALVRDLLDLSSIESEEAAMDVQELAVDGPARSAAASLGDLARKCGVEIAVGPVPAGGLRIAGNARRLEQAFVNLMENALKYTPAGGRVAVRFLDRGNDAVVEVEDTGIGIPSGSLPRIFERFYRVDPSRSRSMGGTGLGLAIVKHIVRAHRGRVEVRSLEGAGTTFTLHLPKAK